jgi:hypothetical protein
MDNIKVVCIDNENTSLTIGRKYLVSETRMRFMSEDTGYLICQPDDETGIYHKNRFITLREAKLRRILND